MGEDLRAHVALLGEISEADKAAFLRSVDIYCAPNLLGESFGVVLIEAMAAETAIVATQLPGYANVARADEDALLVRPGDPKALAAALNRVLEDPVLSAGLVASGRDRAGEFSMDRLADRYVELYTALVQSGP
jgi:phosphatidylinositol alpha-mannosyltransferase